MKEKLLDPIWPAQGQSSRVEQGCSGRPQKWVKGLALFLTLLLMALAGCNSQPDLVPQQLVDAVNDQNLNGAVRLFASDAVVDVGSSVSFSGRREIEHWLGVLFADNLKLNMQHSEVSGDSVTADYTLTLDRTSDLGVASLAGTSVMTVQGGKITKLHFTLDNESEAELLRAILIVGNPRLTYTVLPDPSPMRVSQDQQTSEASLAVLITNGTDQQVEVKSITFLLPEGLQAGDLTSDPTSIHTDSPSNENWSIHPEGGGRFRLASKIDGKGQLDAGNGLSFTFSNIPVNDQPGSWDLEIIEEIGDGNGGSATRTTTIQLAKLPPMFFVSDLNAEPLIVNAGEETMLWWSGSEQATYTISYVDGTDVFTETVEGPPYKYPVSLQETTTFYLIAEAADGEQEVTLQRERTVTVR